jgi:hypothetical protein
VEVVEKVRAEEVEQLWNVKAYGQAFEVMLKHKDQGAVNKYGYYIVNGVLDR